MRSPRRWIKTSPRVPSYVNGKYWIKKDRGRWELLERRRDEPHQSFRLIGRFPTLTEAATYFDAEVKP